MTDKIHDNELLSEEQLDNVAGGTTEETYELIKAIGNVRERTNYSDGKKFYTYLDVSDLAPYLKKTYGIDATINMGNYDIGACVYDDGGDPNKYSLNGKSLTQSQVLGIIKIVNGQ